SSPIPLQSSIMPPKRMTANPTKPLRYRPGKPIAPEESDSEESEGSEAEESEEEPQQPSKRATSEAPAKVSTALKKVDLSKRFEEGRVLRKRAANIQRPTRRKKNLRRKNPRNGKRKRKPRKEFF
ncbi:hypothetical protein C7212DRAFT_336579, partial [Tuber magnatum]